MASGRPCRGAPAGRVVDHAACRHGPVHRDPTVRARDRTLRGALERRGFAIFAIEAGADLDRELARLREPLEALGIGGG